MGITEQEKERDGEKDRKGRGERKRGGRWGREIDRGRGVREREREILVSEVV